MSELDYTDALAAEYVLGTLDFEERMQARALLDADEFFLFPLGSRGNAGISPQLFFAPGKDNRALSRLPGDHQTASGLAWPDSPRADNEVSAALGSSFRATAIGTWSLPHEAGKPHVFRLYRLTPISAAHQKLLDSPARKLGETADNLEGRSRWFQKRQGGTR